jgi:hypothetical protein
MGLFGALCRNSCDNSCCWSELKALLRCLFFEVLQLSFSIPLLVKLHAFIRVVVSKLEHSVNQGSKVVGEGRDRVVSEKLIALKTRGPWR